MADPSKQFGRIHKEFFIDRIVEELTQGGIPCGFTDYPTPPDEKDIIWAALVIARQKYGWRGKLPVGKYDKSKDGVLMRIYDPLWGATDNPLIRGIVESHIPEYMDKMREVAEKTDTKLVRDDYSLTYDMLHGESVRWRLPYN